MLAERFQPDFYDHLAGQAMLADDGKAVELQQFESEVRRIQGARSREDRRARPRQSGRRRTFTTLANGLNGNG
jgi:hypothetical protein